MLSLLDSFPFSLCYVSHLIITLLHVSNTNQKEANIFLQPKERQKTQDI